MTDELNLIRQLRHIRNWEICPRCSGLGSVLYGSTAMWRGGIGGAAMTAGPCDQCWGSGSKSNPWYSHKEFERMQRELKSQAVVGAKALKSAESKGYGKGD